MLNAKDAASVIYRDLEKFYRVLGYYEGQEIKPLDIHEKFIDINLESSLRNPDEYIKRVQFDLMLTEVQSHGRRVFETDKPELSLVYALFSEGIQSLITLRDLSANDIKDWVELVRQTMIEFDQGSLKDLASVLWRSPTRNLRATIYNALLELESRVVKSEGKKESEKKASETTEKEMATSSQKIPKDWHHRDHEWDVPDGDKVQRSQELNQGVRSEQIRELRAHLESVNIQSSLPPELQMSSSEIALLAQELSFLDQNHVDYNLLNWSNAQIQRKSSPEAIAFAEEFLKDLTSAIVSRFQPGLIILLLDLVQSRSWGSSDELRNKIESTIAKTLSHPANQKRLLSSLRDPERAKTTKRLLPYVDETQFPSVIDYFLECSDAEGLLEFLRFILTKELPHEKILMGLGEERLCLLLPHFKLLDWEPKFEFIKRLIRSKSPRLQKQASAFIAQTVWDPSRALETYRLINDETKEVWLKAFQETSIKEPWRIFFKNFISEGLWLSGKDKLIRNRLMMGWCDLALKTFQEDAVDYFEPWIKARRWMIIPKFPDERETILLSMASQAKLKQCPKFQEVFKSEARVLLQNKELKERLEGLIL